LPGVLRALERALENAGDVVIVPHRRELSPPA
jgi:hypothetical protein